MIKHHFQFAVRSASACFIVLAAGAVGCNMTTSGHNVAGVRLYKQGQYPDAVDRFQQAVASNPENADSYYNLGSTLHAMAKVKQNDPQLMLEAENAYNKCLDIDRDHVECHRALGVLLAERGEPERQLALMKNWASSSPKIAAPRIEMARIFEEYGDDETAKRHLEQAVMIDSNSARAFAALGQLHEKTNNYTQALADYRRAYSLNPSLPGVGERMQVLQQTLAANGLLNENGSASAGLGGGSRSVSLKIPSLP